MGNGIRKVKEINMTLEQLEEKMGIEFPKGFHEIYETGAMDWLTVTREEFLKKRSQYLDNPKSFFMLPCMCEPIPFEDISMWNGELEELLHKWEEIEQVHLRSDIKLVPFGQSVGGDMYCFLYQEENEEPMVIQIWHDTFDAPYIEGRNFEEFMYHQILDSLESDIQLEDPNFLAHLEYLLPQYRHLIEGKDKEELVVEYEAMKIDEIEIMNSEKN